MQNILDALARGPGKAPRDERTLVLFHTPWERPDDGWSIAARAYARAMHLGNLDVRLHSWKPEKGRLDEEVIRELRPEYLLAVGQWDFHLLSHPLNSAQQMREAIPFTHLGNGPRGLHCVFERQTLERELVDLLNRSFVGIWAQCSANRDVLVKHGVQNVRLIHHPYFDDDPHLQLVPPAESTRFLWCGRFEPRKAPDLLLKAFLRAFRPGEADLTMKLSPYTHGGTWLTPEQALLDELCEPEVVKLGWTALEAKQHIRFLRRKLSRDSMVLLQATHHVYCSASRGEGLDLPAFAAKLAGRRLCVTDSGGPRDFTTEGDFVVAQKGVVPAHEDYPWGEGATYADFALDDIVAALQAARAAGPSTGERVPAKFRAEAVAKEFADWVSQCVS